MRIYIIFCKFLLLTFCKNIILIMQNSTKRANDFLKIANEFKLGELTTESRHPLTMNLSTLSQTELIKAISILKNIDLGIFEVLEKKVDTILELQELFLKTIGDGNRIFFSGCGSTGRLSLTLEFLWRQSNHSHKESVIGLMAGGDSALIKAIEDFEDHPEYARHHLMDLGFKDGDLLVGSSEGGETPFVIGSVEYALKHSKIKPWFVYCNPDSELLKTTTRSKDIISNSNVKKFNLTVGPMAISGSTRMQASTVILYALGLALLGTDKSAIFLAALCATISSCFVSPSTTAPKVTTPSMSFLFTKLLTARGISNAPGTLIVFATFAPKNTACSSAIFPIKWVMSAL